MIAIIDYGVGNLFSLRSSLRAIGAQAEITDISQKNGQLVFTLGRFSLEQFSGLCGMEKYKNRLLLTPGDVPRFTFRLRKGEDPLRAAQALVELGGAVDVIACASHGVLSGPAVERIEKSVIKELYFLDTVPPKEGVKCEKIKYLSVAHMFAEAIERIYEEVSVSKLFV